MSLLVGLLATEVAFRVPGAFEQILFLDDRSVLCQQVSDLIRLVGEWDLVSAQFGLFNNAHKLQVWSTTDSVACRDAFPNQFTVSPQVLGYVLLTGSAMQVNHVEMQLWRQIERLCSRMSFLPINEELRWSLWRSLICPKLAWHYAICNVPSEDKIAKYAAWLKQFLQGKCRRTRHSWSLRLAIQTGYQGDLQALSTLSQFRTVIRWGRQQLMAPVHLLQTFFRGRLCRNLVAELTSLFACQELQWSLDAGRFSWVWSFQNREWQVFYTLDCTLSFLHHLREHWRLIQLQQWLSQSRRDSQVAQSVQLVVDQDTVPQLRRLYEHVSADGRAVMLGGFTTQATDDASRARLMICNHCQGGPPFLEHVLWTCPVFHDDRWPQRPPSELAARIGWTWPFDLSFLQMCDRLNAMGAIRNRDAKVRTSVGGCHYRPLRR